MHDFENAPHEEIELQLNSKVLEMAEHLGLDLSRTVNDLLTAEVVAIHNARTSRDGRPPAQPI
ncbi:MULTISPECIES: type II toxin-antitoxin system CcdA family antitoxin [unclassified Variovorax]|uniref:type II toxin-antitoxin system CcdA family antitoxin n=1 Tax=unclassified Variovorax TaxID=663243 RepID=UPI001BD2C8A6|nr:MULTISPECIES: type II toxin-antitoxin system CcdA family antitoxin [unclassified Variovorax]